MMTFTSGSGGPDSARVRLRLQPHDPPLPLHRYRLDALLEAVGYRTAAGRTPHEHKTRGWKRGNNLECLMRKRGRPRKFNQPSRLVAITLPEDVIDTLRSRDRDLARAIVAVVSETNKNGRGHRDQRHDQDAELIKIAPGSSSSQSTGGLSGICPAATLCHSGRILPFSH